MLRLRFHREQRRVDRLFHRNRSGLGIAPAGFEIRKSQQIGRDIIQPDRVRLDDFDKTAIIFVVLERAAQQRFGVTANRGQRRPQLVRDVSHKIAPDALQPFEAGDIVQNRQRAPMRRSAKRTGLRGAGIGFKDGGVAFASPPD